MHPRDSTDTSACQLEMRRWTWGIELICDQLQISCHIKSMACSGGLLMPCLHTSCECQPTPKRVPWRK